MRIALIHENPEYRRQFALKYIGKYEISLFDSKLYPEEIVASMKNTGRIDLAIVSINKNNSLAFDYMRAIRKAYEKATVVATQSDSDISQSVFEAGYAGANTLVDDGDILDGLDSIESLV